MSGDLTAHPDPVFVGGTGRSGTHALARVLGRHPLYRKIPVEARFHADPPGLPGLLSGAVGLDDFLAKLRGPWWSRPQGDGSPGGLAPYLPLETLEQAIAAFAGEFESDDPTGAAARLTRALLDPIAVQAGKPAWVENSNFNVAAGPALLRMFPTAKIIHIVRDGRDVAASLVEQHFGPRRLGKALRWWEERLTLSERGAAGVPADRLLTLQLEDFLVNDREGAYARLLEFLAIPDDEHMHGFFDRKIHAGRANIGRWREGLGERRQDRLTNSYASALERLIDADTPGRPLLQRSLERLTATATHAAAS